MKRAILLVLFFVSSVLIYPQNVVNLDDESTHSNVVGLQNATTNPSIEGMVGSLNSIHSDQYSTCFIADDYDLYCWGNRGKEANGFGNSTRSHDTYESPSIGQFYIQFCNSNAI